MITAADTNHSPMMAYSNKLTFIQAIVKILISDIIKLSNKTYSSILSTTVSDQFNIYNDQMIFTLLRKSIQ